LVSWVGCAQYTEYTDQLTNIHSSVTLTPAIG
jgi:hypothetical protein